jgi:hypothetical protein
MTHDAAGGDIRARAAWMALAITIVATALATLGDTAVYERVHNPGVYDRDWGRLLRVMGFAGTWVALAVALRLHEGADADRRALATRRAWLLLWSPALAGGVAELLKILVRRERPALHDGRVCPRRRSTPRF